MTAEKAATVRAALKTQLGLGRKDVSVRAPYHGSIYVTIRKPLAKAPIEEIANTVQHVRRCDVSGDILGGGNTFVTVKYADDVIDAEQARPELVEAVEAAQSQPGYLKVIVDRPGYYVCLSTMEDELQLWKRNAEGECQGIVARCYPHAHVVRTLARQLVADGAAA